ncbi:MAG TPA: hypothetical protein VH044_07100, partial [Polyangiaceae bacterium]|nr:hypothetical protein [Polyangiaceae bacterium]
GRAAMRRAAFTYMAEHPARTSLRTLNRATSFWGFDYLASRQIQAWRGREARAGLPTLALEAACYLAAAALALVTLFGLPAPRGGGRGWLAALALAYELPYTVAFSGGTYHFPVAPLLLPLAAIAAGRPRDAWRGLRASPAARWALALFAVIQAQYAYYAIAMS